MQTKAACNETKMRCEICHSLFFQGQYRSGSGVAASGNELIIKILSPLKLAFHWVAVPRNPAFWWIRTIHLSASQGQYGGAARMTESDPHSRPPYKFFLIPMRAMREQC